MKWHPDCNMWHLITAGLVDQYLADYKGKSKLHPLNLIRQAAQFMARKHDCRNVCAGMRIKSQVQKNPAEVYLENVVAFCDFIREKNPRLEAGVALQGLAGLQLQEATRLTWDRVNLEEGLVEISGEVKNEFRNRAIPICNRALEALKRTIEMKPKSRIQSVCEFVLLSKEGQSYCSNRWNYSKEVKSAFKNWNSRIDWTPKDLRNCLPTFATIHGLQNDLWEMYIGHAPRTVTAKHYVPRINSVSNGERKALDRQMNLFRLHVTEQLNRAISGEFEAKILNFFERPVLQPLAGVQN